MSEQTISIFLKQLRKTSGYSASEVVEKLKHMNISISAKTLYGYESGLSMLNADIFVALCKIYRCDNPMDIFEGTSISSSELSLVEKYRTLDTHGKDMVDTVLDKEHERCVEIKKYDKDNIVSLPDRSYLEVDAVHTRTDISEDDKTEELKQLEDDMMNDDNF